MAASDPTPGWPAVVHSSGLQQQVKYAKVLAVGAGGIGCELLKTLVLSGFENIEVIDMDTIETSNLNRQFLFRKRHVGESKAKVAAEAVRKFRPHAQIVAHQGNVKEPQYDVDFFRKFDLVLNGLDNLEARRHVNRLCLAAEVPLVESGTTGYIGQVSVHKKGVFECFECQSKPSPKTYPVCTIRNTPDKPIHCVVWAKELLFQRLFGRPDVVTDLDEAEANGEDGAEGHEEKEDPSFFLRRDGETADAYARRIFHRVFTYDIERVLRMKDLWTTRTPPTPLVLDDILESPPSNGPHAPAKAAASNGHAGASASASRALGLRDSHQMWSLRDNARVFLESIRTFLEQRPEDVGAAEFDKDDALAVDFVTAAANLRSLAYGIPTQTLFDCKGMAGNIIHAIATTNAIISGLIVVEAMKLLAKMDSHCKATYLSQFNRRMVCAVAPPPPDAKCMVCGKSQLQLQIDTASTTLGQFVTKVLKKHLGINEPTVTCGDFMYEEGSGLDDSEVAFNAKNLPLALASLPGGGVRNGAILEIDDQTQHFQVQVLVSHKDDWDEEKVPEKFTLTGSLPPAQQEAEAGTAGTAGTAGAEAGPSSAAAAAGDDNDVVELVEAPPASTTEQSGKRKRPAESDAEPAPSKGKRAKAADDDDCICLD
ncbi:hypothetical protein WJX72_010622 [[Myrmecia] bisecta]|uniref:SUMO-activating enzyme subunit n=1 Tax=[Myrmecia] bisecta TaxID=41462 RepID=A0AAW1P8P4_9CHLO